MLNLLWNLVGDDSANEAKALAGMLKEVPELPDWSGAVQPLLDRLRHYNGVKRSLDCRVLSGMPFNALALSHKTIVIAESLVDFCRGQTHQMAFVIAHELSHLHRGHAREQSRATAMAGMLTFNPLLAMGVKALLGRVCSRENEFEADRDATTFCHRAGYSVQAGADFLERLRSGELPSGVIQQLMSTHPPLAERLEEIRGTANRLRTNATE